MSVYSDESYRLYLQHLADLEPEIQIEGEQVSGRQYQLPYSISSTELVGEATNWILRYLNEESFFNSDNNFRINGKWKKCPPKLTVAITRNVLSVIDKSGNGDAMYTGLQMRNIVANAFKSFCRRLQDNVEMNKILSTVEDTPDDLHPIHCVAYTKNTRRFMEDRHICVDDLNGIYNTDNHYQPTSFYGVFDGHSGIGAAAYTASQFTYLLANHSDLAIYPQTALSQTFRDTDLLFENKNKSSGCTAVCALYQPIEKKLHVGWVGDSKALLARKGQLLSIVRPHKPDNERERSRVESLGGYLTLCRGELRLNGVINLTRAIGDVAFKPFIISIPDIISIEGNGDEDFLVMASDGLWDYVKIDQIASTVYEMMHEENLEAIPNRLIELAKKGSSGDNITVIVIFFKQPKKIIAPELIEVVKMPSYFDFCVSARAELTSAWEIKVQSIDESDRDSTEKPCWEW